MWLQSQFCPPIDFDFTILHQNIWPIFNKNRGVTKILWFYIFYTFREVFYILICYGLVKFSTLRYLVAWKYSSFHVTVVRLSNVQESSRVGFHRDGFNNTFRSTSIYNIMRWQRYIFLYYCPNGLDILLLLDVFDWRIKREIEEWCDLI